MTALLQKSIWTNSQPSQVLRGLCRLFMVLLLVLAGSSVDAATARSWAGTASNLWSNANNWSPAGVPVNGDSLSFPSGAANVNNTNDLNGLSLAAISVSSGYVIGGNGVILTGTQLVGNSSALNFPIDIQGNSTFVSSGTFGAQLSVNASNVMFTGINLNGGLDVHANAVSVSSSYLGGTLAGTGAITSGQLTLAASGTYSGTISCNTLNLSGANLPNATFTNAFNVHGNGTIGAFQGSQVYPGQISNTPPYASVPGSAGVMNTGNLNLQTYETFQINGPTPGTGYSQFNVTGTVLITGGGNISINMDPSYVPAPGQQFVLINNDGSDPVSGTFYNQPEGTVLTANGYQFVLSYHGGTGNDVTLTYATVSRNWTGASGTAWSQAGNWSVGAPQSGDSVIFPASAANTTNTNDIASLQLGGMTFGAGGYTLNGNAIVLTGPYTSPGGNTLNTPIDLRASTFFGVLGPRSGPATNDIFGGLVDINSAGVTVNNAQFLGGLNTHANDVAMDFVTLRGSLTGSGNYQFFAATLGASGSFSGSIGGLSQSGLILDSPSLPSAAVSAVYVYGNGQVGNFSGGFITLCQLAPNVSSGCASNAPGQIRSKNLHIDDSATFQINGPTPGTGYSQFVATGTISMGIGTGGYGPALNINLDPSYVPAPGQQFVLIDNQGSGSLTATFAHLPEGSIIILNNNRYVLSYRGGDGNDVVLTAQATVHLPSTVTVTPSSNPIILNQSGNITATVSGSGPTPSGNVTFYDGATQLSSGLLGNNGSATLSTYGFALGTHNIRADYAGDANYTASSGSGVAVIVAPRSQPSFSVVSSQNPSVVGHPVTFTATVADTYTPPRTATGSVNFFVDGTLTATIPLSSGQAVFTTSSLAAGGRSIVATYDGDSNFTAVTSVGAPVYQSVAAFATPTTTIGSSLNPSVVAQSVTFTVNVSGAYATPTGTVTFKDGVTTLAAVPLSAGIATLSTSTLTAGPHVITANYSGDTQYSGSTVTLSGGQVVTAVAGQPNTARTWTGAVNNLWSTPGNWMPAGAPLSGDSLTFPTSNTGVTVTNDLVGLTVHGISMGGGPYTINGNGIVLTADCVGGIFNIPVDVEAGGVTLNGVTVNQSINIGAAGAVLRYVVANNGLSVNSNMVTLQDVIVSGNLNGSGNMSVSGPSQSYVGYAVIRASGNYTGTISGTKVYLDGISLPFATISGGAYGNGTVGSVVGSVAPGNIQQNLTMSSFFQQGVNEPNFLTSSPAVLNAGTLNLTASTQIRANNIDPGSGYGQIDVTGAVNISPGAGLSLYFDSTFDPPVGHQFVLINNTGSGPISGVFANYAEGATFVDNNHQYQVSYRGGSGNDMVLTVVPYTPPSRVTVVASSGANPGLFTLTAVVTGTGATPTGTVNLQVTNNSTIRTIALGAVTLNAGVATVNTPTLQPGYYTVYALYNGDATHPTAQTQISLVVPSNFATQSNVTVSSSANPSVSGQSVTFAATFSNIDPADNVSAYFYDGMQSLAVVPIVSGAASYTTSALSTGTHYINVSITNTFYQGSNSVPGGQLVTGASGLNVSPLTVGAGTAGVPIAPVTFVGSGGTPGYTFSVSSGLLPPGVSLSTNGVLSGTPTTQGFYTFNVSVTDMSGQSVYRIYAMNVAAVTATAQTINFANPGAQTAGTTLNLAATASSGLTVTFSSLNTSVCTVSGSVATFVAAGTCTIAADQSGNTSYSAAPRVTQSFTVSAAQSQQSQTITFAGPGAQSVGGSLTLSASATSGLIVSFSSLTNAVCTVSGSTANLLAAGTCTIAADQAGNASYSAATRVTRSFTVSTGAQAQTINFVLSPGAVTVGTAIALSASATSGLAVTFSSLTPAVCTVTGATANAIGLGNCTIAADQAGNGSYAAAPRVTQIYLVSANVSLPGAPTNLHCAPGVGQALCIFTPAADTGSSVATSFSVACSGGGLSVSINGPASPLIVFSLVYGINYSCTVSGVNGSGTGPASSPPITLTSLAGATVPSPPIVTRAIAGNGTAVVAFTPSPLDGGSPITAYTATSTPGNISFGCQAPCSSIYLYGLNNGTAYTFTVTAANSAGISQGSNSSNVVIPRSTNPAGIPVPPLAQRGGNIDVDGSGKAQILLRSSAGAYQVGRLVNNQFQFSNGSSFSPDYRVIAFGDFNGDGKSDIAQQNMTQGEFGDVIISYGFDLSSQLTVRSVKVAWLVQAIADMDGDGNTDMVFRFTGDDGIPNDTGVSYIWFMDGNTVTKVRKRGGAPLGWTLLGAADINGDLAADMIYVDPNNNLKALMATPQRTCANLSAGSLPAGHLPLKMADFLNNGRAAILSRHPTTGVTQLLSLDASALTLPAFTGDPDIPNAPCTSSNLLIPATALNLPAVDPSWQFYAAGDYNGDGYVDIVWKQPNGTLVLWLMGANNTAPTVINNAGTAPSGFPVVQP